MIKFGFTYWTLSFLYLSVFLLAGCGQSVSESEVAAYVTQINDYRGTNYLEITDSSTSRFNAEEREMFLKKPPIYFEPDIDFRVEATFDLDTSYPVFQMPTTTDRLPNYRIYGFLTFQVRDTLCKLTAYQNYDARNHPEYGKYLFVPFKDKTSEFSTYGGGRYMDIPIPTSDKAELDFNKAYNPLCAYAERWSCPLVPMNNDLQVAIFAGEKKYK